MHSFMLTEFAEAGTGWSTRKDLAPPAGYPKMMDFDSTDPTKFSKWTSDRAAGGDQDFSLSAGLAVLKDFLRLLMTFEQCWLSVQEHHIAFFGGYVMMLSPEEFHIS